MLPALQSLRAVIRETAPAAEEAIRMGTPTYLYHGNLVSFAAAAKHCASLCWNCSNITVVNFLPD
ncbi:hypothetical protein AB4144_36105 [Rhizobiaceae sp. 2RAB30]